MVKSYLIIIAVLISTLSTNAQKAIGIGGGIGTLKGALAYVTYEKEFEVKYDTINEIETQSRFTWTNMISYEYRNYKGVNMKVFHLSSGIKTRLFSYLTNSQKGRGLYFFSRSSAYFSRNFEHNIFSTTNASKYELGINIGPQIEYRYDKRIGINIIYLQNIALVKSLGNYSNQITTGIYYKL